MSNWWHGSGGEAHDRSLRYRSSVAPLYITPPVSRSSFMSHDPFSRASLPHLARCLRGIAAHLSRWIDERRGSTHDASDYDIGLYHADAAGLDTDRLRRKLLKAIVDVHGRRPRDAHGRIRAMDCRRATWLVIGGLQVDASLDLGDQSTNSRRSIEAAGRDIGMYYQPGASAWLSAPRYRWAGSAMPSAARS